MIIKSASFLYLFDFDGTVAGSDVWQGFFKNCRLSFQQLHFNPSEVLDIRWCILTSRPIIDTWLVKAVCRKHKLTPEQIIMGPTFRWNFEGPKQEAEYKEKIIRDILQGTFNIEYTDVPITKVCYIDNNADITKPINAGRGDQQYIAISVAELMTRDFTQLIL